MKIRNLISSHNLFLGCLRPVFFGPVVSARPASGALRSAVFVPPGPRIKCVIKEWREEKERLEWRKRRSGFVCSFVRLLFETGCLRPVFFGPVVSARPASGALRSAVFVPPGPRVLKLEKADERVSSFQVL